MDAIDAILGRRSVRSFLEKEVSCELIEKLLEAGAAAPSACNRAPVDFYTVTNKEILARLDRAGMFTKMPSPLVMVVVGNMKRALPRSLSEYWIQDAAAATENILVMATALGLSSCWNGVYPQRRVMERVSEILSLDEESIPFALIHIGYSEETPEPHSGYDKSKVKFIK